MVKIRTNRLDLTGWILAEWCGATTYLTEYVIEFKDSTTHENQLNMALEHDCIV